jgi:hypothetical protein
MRKIVRKLSLKKEKVVNQTTGKKTLKKVVGLCAINFKIGFADYNQKSRASLLTLEALADGEGGSSGEGTIGGGTGVTYDKYCIMCLDCYDSSGYKTGKKYRACIVNGPYDCVRTYC